MTYQEALEIAKKVIKISKRGMNYDGTENSTNLVDWILDGDPEDMTIEEIAADWDE